MKHSIPLFDFDSSRSAEDLAELDARFLLYLPEELRAQTQAFRQDASLSKSKNYAEFLLQTAVYLERFLATYFDIEHDLASLNQRLVHSNAAARFKSDVLRPALRKYQDSTKPEFAALHQQLCACLEHPSQPMQESELYQYAMQLLTQQAQTQTPMEQVEHETEAAEAPIEVLMKWAAAAYHHEDGRALSQSWTGFKLPQSVDFHALVPTQSEHVSGSERLSSAAAFRQRQGFDLTDVRMSMQQVQSQAHYCVYCHKNEGDYCSKGFYRSKKQPSSGFRTNPLGNVLHGCPVEEKISEMNLLRAQGHALAALAVAMVDNPMIPATGHRICNDCMKACIYQKQEPVDIPQVETGTLTDVLHLPWGIEIYDLLTRWNPMRTEQYCLKPDNGYKVMVSGMGPAGFSMVHYLTMEGCTVVGIDGLKVEPLPDEWLEGPVRDFTRICSDLSTRKAYGFGGVMEYGITSRWDKNFLTLLYLVLARRERFSVCGGVALGNTLGVEQVWELGFDHLCIAHGSGLPRVLDVPGSMSTGMRQASDFLMMLQLTRAAQKNSLANLDLRFPVAVIGGGLTAIDTATEAQAYYLVQIEKLAERYQRLLKTEVEETLLKNLSFAERRAFHTMMGHAQELQSARAQAKREGGSVDVVKLLRQWGAVTLIYRRALKDSPAYVNNHEEVHKALEEGIYYAENLQPVEVKTDESGHVRELVCERTDSPDGQKERVSFVVSSILVAAGTSPNTLIKRHCDPIELDHNHIRPYALSDEGNLLSAQKTKHCKEEAGHFTSYAQHRRHISFIGDAHPTYVGSVINAIASAKHAYPSVLRALRLNPVSEERGTHLMVKVRASLTTRLLGLRDLDDKVVEIRVHSPMAAKHFEPGQFFRLQTFETGSRTQMNTLMQAPLQTISGAGTTGEHIRMFLFKNSYQYKLLKSMNIGDPLVLMGPSGQALSFAAKTRILMMTTSWGAAVALSMLPLIREREVDLTLIAMLGSAENLSLRNELESVASQIVWSTANDPAVTHVRPQDLSVHRQDVLDFLLQQDRQPQLKYKLSDYDHLFLVGSTALLHQVETALKGDLGSLFSAQLHCTATVGVPMQCMLKGVCGQCLLWRKDANNGQRTQAVFACGDQDWELATIDLTNLGNRQRTSSISETITARWLNYVLDREQSDLVINHPSSNCWG